MNLTRALLAVDLITAIRSSAEPAFRVENSTVLTSEGAYQTPHSPPPLPVLTVPGAADAKANSWQQKKGKRAR